MGRLGSHSTGWEDLRERLDLVTRARARGWLALFSAVKGSPISPLAPQRWRHIVETKTRWKAMEITGAVALFYVAGYFLKV